MKKIVLVLLLAVSIFAVASSSDSSYSNEDILRIHIRANSNDEIDQEMKLNVRDEVVEFLNGKLEGLNSLKESVAIVESNIEEIEKIALDVIGEYGKNYDVNVKIKNEYFPTREYEGVILESGDYESVIIEIGSGQGDNWWCVVFPPLCFIDGEEIEGEEIIYKSKIKEIWDKYIK